MLSPGSGCTVKLARSSPLSDTADTTSGECALTRALIGRGA